MPRLHPARYGSTVPRGRLAGSSRSSVYRLVHPRGSEDVERRPCPLRSISRALDFVGFRLMSIRIARQTTFACWIFVGFRWPLEHTFACGRWSKTAVEQVFCFVGGDGRSEEHTSELQSPCNLVC